MTGRSLYAEQALGDFLNPFAVTLGVYKSRRRGGHAARGNDNASVQRVLFDLLVGGERQAIDAGQDQRWIANAEGLDDVPINKVQAKSCVENLRDHVVCQKFSHRFIDTQIFTAGVESGFRGNGPGLAGDAEAGPCIVIG